MNDTTRDDRLEKDRERRQSDPEYRAWRYNNDLNHVEAIYEFVDRRVAEAVAARDAEIRDALLSDETVQRVEATVSYMDGYRDHDIADGVIGTALDAIGLHGDGTGGQG